MGERRGDGMTAFKTAMNNYQSSRETIVSSHYYFA
jgi:hypothetical protein